VCVIERNGKLGHSKNDYRSHITGKRLQQHHVNYFQSSYMGTTNKLLWKALQKRTHSCRELEAAIVTYCQTVGENSEGLNQPSHHYQIIQEVLYDVYQQWFRWHRRSCIVSWTAQQIRHWLRQRKRWHVWWHSNRHNRSSMKRVMMMNI